MSSACVCHIDQWCFYCEIYLPLERKHDQQKRALEKVILELELSRECAYHASWEKAMGYAINKLKAVLEQDVTQIPCQKSNSDQ